MGGAIMNVSAAETEGTRTASRTFYVTAVFRVLTSALVLAMVTPGGRHSSALGAEIAQPGGDESSRPSDHRSSVISGQLVRISNANAAASAPASAQATDPMALDASTKRQMVRLARLEADLGGGEEILLPDALRQGQNADTVASALRDEKLALAVGREALASQLAPLDLDKALAGAQIEVTKRKQDVLERQVSLLQMQLHDIDSLASKGLATSSQRVALEQSLLQTEYSRLDLDLLLLKAQQDLTKVERSITDLRRQARNATLAELNQAEDALAASSRQAHAGADQPRDTRHADGSDALYVIVRDTAGAFRAFPVIPATADDSAGRQTAETSAMIAQGGR